MTLRNLCLYDKLYRKLYKKFKIKGKRLSSSPFISGDGFRCISDLIIEEKKDLLQIENIQNKQIVFLKPDLFEEFSKLLIQQNRIFKIILIVHNGDISIDRVSYHKLKHLLLHGFVSNLTFEDEKVSPIPIGLENFHHFNNGISNDFLDIKKTQKKNRILYGFNINTNVESRSAAFNILSELAFADHVQAHSYAYRKILNEYKFVVSPEGNGIDCHRTWEALYLDIIPIVQKSVLTVSLKKLGFPLYLVESWEELKTLNPIQLEEHYKKIDFSKTKELLNMEYWIKKIEDF